LSLYLFLAHVTPALLWILASSKKIHFELIKIIHPHKKGANNPQK